MIGYILILLRVIENFNKKGVMLMINEAFRDIYGIIGVMITISSLEVPPQPYRFNLLMRLWNSVEKVVHEFKIIIMPNVLNLRIKN